MIRFMKKAQDGEEDDEEGTEEELEVGPLKIYMIVILGMIIVGIIFILVSTNEIRSLYFTPPDEAKATITEYAVLNGECFTLKENLRTIPMVLDESKLSTEWSRKCLLSSNPFKAEISYAKSGSKINKVIDSENYREGRAIISNRDFNIQINSENELLPAKVKITVTR